MVRRSCKHNSVFNADYDCCRWNSQSVWVRVQFVGMFLRNYIPNPHFFTITVITLLSALVCFCLCELSTVMLLIVCKYYRMLMPRSLVNPNGWFLRLALVPIDPIQWVSTTWIAFPSVYINVQHWLCTRNHTKPGISRVLLIPNFYDHIGLSSLNQQEYDTDQGLEYEESETYQHFKWVSTIS